MSDDYGFTDLQLAYEVRRPTYLLTDPYVSMFIINSLVEDSLNQKINFEWNLTDMQLMPDDEVHFHLELTDNDIISGPKKQQVVAILSKFHRLLIFMRISKIIRII